MRSIRFALSAAAVIALAATGVGCKKESLGVRVVCNVPTKASVECDVTQTAGKSEMEACWDFEVECGNGAVVTAPRQCRKVKNGGTERVSIAADALGNVDECGGPQPRATVSNLTINGKKVN